MVVIRNFDPAHRRRCRAVHPVLHPPRRVDLPPAIAPTISGSQSLSAKSKRFAFAAALAVAALAMYLGIIVSVGNS
jgi:hypothetical protein